MDSKQFETQHTEQGKSKIASSKVNSKTLKPQMDKNYMIRFGAICYILKTIKVVSKLAVSEAHFVCNFLLIYFASSTVKFNFFRLVCKYFMM